MHYETDDDLSGRCCRMKLAPATVLHVSTSIVSVVSQVAQTYTTAVVAIIR